MRGDPRASSGRAMRSGLIVVYHLSVQFPFAGVIWQLLHHLIGLRGLGFDVYYLEDGGGQWVYDPVTETRVSDPGPNLALVTSALGRFGFADRWAFRDPGSGQYLGMPRTVCMQLLRDADAVINLCGALRPGDEHANTRCLVYLGTDPGRFQVELEQRDPEAIKYAACHHLFFTYAYNLGSPDCLLPTGGLSWKPTRPPVLLDHWAHFLGVPDSGVFTTVGTWENKGKDFQISGEKYSWSKHINFMKMLDVPKRSGQQIELATNLRHGPDHERMNSAGFKLRSAIPMSLDLDDYRNYIGSSRGEFSVAKDVVARTRSGWFSDRSACYLAAGRPVVIQRTGFECSLPVGAGLLGFDNGDQAADAIRGVNGDYARHSRAAREIAVEYFDAAKLLKEIVEAAGL
jgi:hypothetical protein